MSPIYIGWVTITTLLFTNQSNHPATHLAIASQPYSILMICPYQQLQAYNTIRVLIAYTYPHVHAK